MSGNPYILPGGRGIPVERPSPPKKRGCGCLGSVGFMIVVAVGLLVFLNPWSLHMGGRWTPALTWHGVGKLHSTTGATYVFFIEVSPYLEHSRRGAGGLGPSQNISGTAKICTPQGEVYPVTVTGYLKHAWLDADGKPLTFYLRSKKDATPKLNLDLYGSWQGQQMVLEDKGNWAMSFAPDGHAKGYLVGTNSPAENTSGSLSYAAEGDFTAACGGKGGTSF
jgi:hypothetical protein